MRRVTVTWFGRDGKSDMQETYNCENIVITSELLVLHPSAWDAHDEPVRKIPLAGIRIWTEM